jgi:hypothetical protein
MNDAHASEAKQFVVHELLDRERAVDSDQAAMRTQAASLTKQATMCSREDVARRLGGFATVFASPGEDRAGINGRMR